MNINRFEYNSAFRYADEVALNNEVLVTEYDQLKAVKVKEISILALQGEHIHFVTTFSEMQTQQ